MVSHVVIDEETTCVNLHVITIFRPQVQLGSIQNVH